MEQVLVILEAQERNIGDIIKALGILTTEVNRLKLVESTTTERLMQLQDCLDEVRAVMESREA
jgi:hypothetical protein